MEESGKDKKKIFLRYRLRITDKKGTAPFILALYNYNHLTQHSNMSKENRFEVVFIRLRSCFSSEHRLAIDKRNAMWS